MKYIKTYEFKNPFKQTQKYFPGDYIVIEFFPPAPHQFNKFFQVIEYLAPTWTSNVVCRVMDCNGKTMLIMSKQIIRKMTPKEIEEFKFKLNVNKYNL